MDSLSVSTDEIKDLMQAVYTRYGYDFSDYAMASLKRRVSGFAAEHKINCIHELKNKITADTPTFQLLLHKISVGVTEMFRDEDFFHTIDQSIIPWLQTWPFIKIWHAGCSTGEEVYSMAILLKKAGLLKRAQIYATDINENSLNIARKGIYPEALFETYDDNYKKFVPHDSLENYCRKKYNSFIINRDISERIFFANHNLVIDGIFSEMNLIMCRNVLIYFNSELKNKVLQLFCDSLSLNGLLCLGIRESLYNSSVTNAFVPASRAYKIYKKVIQ